MTTCSQSCEGEGEGVVIVVSLSEIGLSWSVWSDMLKKWLYEDVVIVVSLSER